MRPWASLHSRCFLCNLSWTCVRAGGLSVFLAYWLLWLVRLFFSPSLLCPCPAELVIERIDWLAVGLIDPQGRTAGYWQMVLQCPPSIVFSLRSLPLLYFLPSLSALLNLSLTSFHLQSPLSPSTFRIHPPVRLSVPLSLSLFWVCCRYRSSMQQRSMGRIMGAGPAGSQQMLYGSTDSCPDTTR